MENFIFYWNPFDNVRLKLTRISCLFFILLSYSCTLPALPDPYEFSILNIILRASKSQNSTKLDALNYPGTPYIFTRNTQIIPITPSFTGQALEFSIQPSLPSGISIHNTTGVLSGNPTETSVSTNYIITARNLQESVTAAINLSVTEGGTAALGIWSAEAYIKPPNTGMNDGFGSSIAISSDTIAVSAFYEGSNQTTITNGPTASSDNSATNSGAVYVFRRTGNNWAQEAYIKAPNGQTSDEFGFSVSLSDDTIVTSARNEDSFETTITNGATASSDNTLSNSGAVYVFRRTGSIWAQEAYIKPVNADATDQFGTNVAIDGDTIAVGVCGEDSNQTTITNGSSASGDNSSLNSGAVYVYRRTGSIWAQEAYLKAPNADPGDSFCNVSISADTIAVGANLENSNQTTITNGSTASINNGLSASGAVYIFRRSGTNWNGEAYLKAPNAGPNDQFGSSLSLNLDTVAVGSSFESSNQTTITNGATGSSDNSAADSGAVYIFKRTGSTWANEAYIKAPNAEAGDRFGVRVSLISDLLAVGAYREGSSQNTITNGMSASSDNSAFNAGAVYIYRRSGNNWNGEAYLKAPNAESNDEFGLRLALWNDTIAVGAPNEDSNQTTITNGSSASPDNSASNSGAVYVFRRQ